MKNSTLKSRKGGCLFKLLKLFIFVVIVLAVAIYFSLGYIADYALKTVTAGTGINAGLSSLSIMPSEQKVQVGNFFITNPPNFKQCDAIAFQGRRTRRRHFAFRRPLETPYRFGRNQSCGA